MEHFKRNKFIKKNICLAVLFTETIERIKFKSGLVRLFFGQFSEYICS